jgi:hypothetical protein
MDGHSRKLKNKKCERSEFALVLICQIPSFKHKYSKTLKSEFRIEHGTLRFD